MATTTVTSVRLPDDMRDRYDHLARLTGQSRNDLIVTAMSEYIERELREVAMIQEGLDDIARGDTLTLDEAVAELAARGMLDRDALARDREQRATA